MSKSIAVLGSDQVPLTYSVPVPGTLTPLAASAVFDGSAAATFQPALSFYDSDGNLISRAVGDTVAAGGSAEVSWFPGGGLGGAGGTSTGVQWFIVRRNAAQTMNAGTTDTIIWDSSEFSDSSLFSLGTVHHANDCVVILKPGVVFFSVELLPNVLDPSYNLAVFTNATNANSGGGTGFNPMNTWPSKGLITGAGVNSPRDYQPAVSTATPWNVYAEYTNFDASNRNIAFASMGGFFMPNSVLAV